MNEIGSMRDTLETLKNDIAYKDYNDYIVMSSFEAEQIAANMERYLDSKFSEYINNAQKMLAGETTEGTLVLDGKMVSANSVSEAIAAAMNGDSSEDLYSTVINVDGTQTTIGHVHDAVSENIASSACLSAAYGAIANGGSVDYLTAKANSLAGGTASYLNEYLSVYSTVITGKSDGMSKLQTISSVVGRNTEVSYNDSTQELIINTDQSFGMGSPLSLASFGQAFSTVAETAAGILLVAGGLIGKIIGAAIFIGSIILKAIRSYTEDVDDWYVMNKDAKYSTFAYYPVLQYKASLASLQSKGGEVVSFDLNDDSQRAFHDFIVNKLNNKDVYAELHNDYHLFLWSDGEYWYLQVFCNCETTIASPVAWISRLTSGTYQASMLVSSSDDTKTISAISPVGTDTLPSTNKDYIYAFGIGCSLSQVMRDNMFYGYGPGANAKVKVQKLLAIINQWKSADRTTGYGDWINPTINSGDESWLQDSGLFIGVYDIGNPALIDNSHYRLSKAQCCACTTKVFNCYPVDYTNFSYPTVDAKALSELFSLTTTDNSLLIYTILEKWFYLSNYSSAPYVPYSPYQSQRSYGIGLRDQAYYDKIGGIAAAAIITAVGVTVTVVAMTVTRIKLRKKAILANAAADEASWHVAEVQRTYGKDSAEYTQALGQYNKSVKSAKWYNLLTGSGYQYASSSSNESDRIDLDLKPVISLIK